MEELELHRDSGLAETREIKGNRLLEFSHATINGNYDRLIQLLVSFAGSRLLRLRRRCLHRSFSSRVVCHWRLILCLSMVDVFRTRIWALRLAESVITLRLTRNLSCLLKLSCLINRVAQTGACDMKPLLHWSSLFSLRFLRAFLLIWIGLKLETGGLGCLCFLEPLVSFQEIFQVVLLLRHRIAGFFDTDRALCAHLGKQTSLGIITRELCNIHDIPHTDSESVVSLQRAVSATLLSFGLHVVQTKHRSDHFADRHLLKQTEFFLLFRHVGVGIWSDIVLLNKEG